MPEFGPILDITKEATRALGVPRVVRTQVVTWAREVIEVAMLMIAGILDPRKERVVIAQSPTPLFVVGASHNRNRQDAAGALRALVEQKAIPPDLLPKAQTAFPATWRQSLGAIAPPPLAEQRPELPPDFSD
jgi:hypothetical protein